MNKRFTIFDMDGTLVDSMRFWRVLGREYLESKGIIENIDDVLEQIKPMTMSESARLFVNTFSLQQAPEQVEAEMNQMMDDHYKNDIPLKSGVKTYLEMLQAKGVRMCVASATATELMEACLTRLDVRQHFQFILSCETVGTGKSKPDIYLEAARQFCAKPCEIAVYEDALYAVRTAKESGFYTIGVYDTSSEKNWNEISRVADEVILDWSDVSERRIRL